MEQITDISICSGLENSQYVKPFRVSYTQNGIKKKWDLVDSHDSVAILVHNVTRDVFVFVKQFRPAVYISIARGVLGSHVTQFDTSVVPPVAGCTLELCAGIVDKNASVREIACDEVEEECGYSISPESLEVITIARNGVGLFGSQNSIFYARVTDDMKVSDGGGVAAEGEFIETVEVPIGQTLDFIRDSTVQRPTGMLFALMWFHVYKAAKESAN